MRIWEYKKISRKVLKKEKMYSILKIGNVVKNILRNRKRKKEKIENEKSWNRCNCIHTHTHTLCLLNRKRKYNKLA